MPTNLVRPPKYFFNQAESGFGDRHSAFYLDEQVRMNDPLSGFGPRVFTFEDDFTNTIDTTHQWTKLSDGSTGNATLTDAAGGVYTVATAGADNDYHGYSSQAEIFKFAANKRLRFEVRFKLAEATTGNDAAFWFGLTDTLTTGGLQANAAGPLASYDGALFWKDEDGTVINFETSNATTQDTLSSMVAFADDTWTILAFEFDGTATTSAITPYYNVTGTWDMTKAATQTITLSGLEEMHVVFGVKAGPGGSAETLTVDYIRCAQVR